MNKPPKAPRRLREPEGINKSTSKWQTMLSLQIVMCMQLFSRAVQLHLFRRWPPLTTWGQVTGHANTCCLLTTGRADKLSVLSRRPSKIVQQHAETSLDLSLVDKFTMGRWKVAMLATLLHGCCYSSVPPGLQCSASGGCAQEHSFPLNPVPWMHISHLFLLMDFAHMPVYH